MVEKNDMLSCERIMCSSVESASAILSLESLFPVKIQYTREGIIKFLQNPANLHFFLKKGDKIIGYLLATPQNDAVEELKNDDSLMERSDSCYYLDQIAVIPDERKGLSFLLLVDALVSELRAMGVYKFSSHILASNKLNILIARKFRNSLILRRPVNLAMHGNAPFEYMEAVCKT